MPNVENAIVGKCTSSLALVTAVFTLNFSSYRTLESLQSSINPEIGLYALCALYASYLLSSMFLPPLILPRFKTGRILASSLVFYTCYTMAHFYPTAATLIPSAILCGLAGGPLWSAGQVYVTQISKVHAEITKQDEIKMVGIYLGVFFMSNSAMVIGNALAAGISLVMSNSEVDTTEDNVFNASTYDQIVYNASSDDTPNARDCGEQYLISADDDLLENKLPKTTMYAIVAVFIGLQIVAIVLSLFLPDVKKLERLSSKTDILLNDRDLSDDSEEGSNFPNAVNETKLNKLEQEEILDRNENPEKPLMSLYAIFILLLQDATGVLMIMLTLNFGFLHSFVAGDFTRSWVTCTYGVERVMPMMAVFGVVTTFASAISGQLLRFITLNRLLWMNMMLEISIFVILLIWNPEEEEEWVFYCIISACALCFGIYRSQVPNVYSVLWKDNLPPAMALLGTCEAVAYALMFGLGDIIPLPKMILTLASGLLGTIAYRFAWNLRKNI